MSISTGDSRHPAKKSTSAAAAGGPADDAGSPDEPVGGVLPVKKSTRASGGTGGAAGRTGSGGRSAANGSSRTASTGTGAGKATGNATKTTPAKASPSKSAGKASGKTAAPLFGGKGAGASASRGKGRRPVAPVRVAQSRNWGPILLYVVTGVVALAIIAIGAWPIYRDSLKPSWQEQAAGISGIINYIDESSPSFDPTVVGGQHQAGVLTYPMSPPVGGPHNGRWQNCMGDVYTSEVAKEHAVHSLEHGAVWITYQPDLPQDQIDKLASKVEGREFMLMSPYPDLDRPISLQAWGYQLKVDNADDGRIDDFISALRVNATREPEAGCSGGITVASPTPLDLGEGMSQ